MATITAADVNKLRNITGAGMMDCKNALVEANGDTQAAIDILRKKGQKVANKRADRDAAEGVVLATTTADHTRACVVMVNCETDFVAKNDDFVKFTQNVLTIAIEKKAASKDDLLKMDLEGLSIQERLDEMMGKIGEKIQLGEYLFVEGAKSFAYVHPGNRLASIIALSKANDEVGKDLAMQIAAMSPVAIDKDDIDPQIIEKEKEIAMELARNEGKAENMLEKIAMGRIGKFVNEATLLNQDFIKDTKKSVRQHLQDLDKELKVIAFKRVALG